MTTRDDSRKLHATRFVEHFVGQDQASTVPNESNSFKPTRALLINSMSSLALSVGARLLDFVGAVEASACDDMSGHGVECIAEGELVGQVDLGVQCEELEDVGVWPVRARGLGPAQPRWPKGPLPCLSPGIGLGSVRPFSGMPLSEGSMPSVSAWVAGFAKGRRVLDDEHEFRCFGWRRCPGEGG